MMKTVEPTQVIISIDIEPDARLVDPTARPRWTGFEKIVPEIERLRAQLAEATRAAVHFCWLVRVDEQIKHTYGRADWGLREYRAQLDQLRAQGDAIGVHTHSWRWDDQDATWVADHGDPVWVAHCVRLSLETFRETMGYPATVFSHGDHFLSNDLVGLLERLGVRHELTLEPGRAPTPGMTDHERATGELPDFRRVPRVPYRPAPGNFRRAGTWRRRRMWLMPVATGRVADSRASEVHTLLVGAPFGTNRQLFDAHCARFPDTPVVALARTDVLLDAYNGSQFRQFIDFLGERAREQPLVLATPREACRAYRRQLAARGLGRFRFARWVMSTCDEAATEAKNPEKTAPALLPAFPAVPKQQDHEGAVARTIQALEQEVALLRQRLAQIESSLWWRLRRRLLQLRSLLCTNLSRGHRNGLLRRLLRIVAGNSRTKLRQFAKLFFKTVYLWLEDEPVVILPRTGMGTAGSPGRVNAPYAHWLAMHAPRPSDLAAYLVFQGCLTYRPVISILLPVFNPPAAWLRAALQSVVDQIYPEWELCIADDASTDPEVHAVIAEYAARDSRIRVAWGAQNEHISATSNAALGLATGEFCALLDHDDLLAPDALFHNVVVLNQQPRLDMLYSDEDKIDEHGMRAQPHFKPQWSPETLLGGNYICHLLVARTALLREVGGFRRGLEGAQDFDLVLRLTERTNRIHHIPRVLYHWRQHGQSTAQNPAAKPYAYRAGQRAIEDALERRREHGAVSQVPNRAGSYIVRFNLPQDCRTRIVIPTRDLAPVLDTCLTSLFERTRQQDFEVVVVDNGSREPRTFELFEKYARLQPTRFSVRRDDGDFNFSRLVNAGAAGSRAPYLLFLNNDVEVCEPDWLSALLELGQRPSVGCVGACLLYPNGSVQHAGVVITREKLAVHPFRHADRLAIEHTSQLQLLTNYSAVTGACLLVRRAVFEKVGGFDESFAVDFNDVDFCLRVREAGYNNVVVPHAKLWHHELLSRGNSQQDARTAARHAQAQQRFRSRWSSYVSADPCLSPHLVPSGSNLRLVA